jgi:hypothetical protein
MPVLNSVMLSVPEHPEEALNWCGPATGQMIMEGYPTGSRSYLQEDVWMAIQKYKIETMWDTDPKGLSFALLNLCPPLHGWSVEYNSDAQKVMFTVAKFMKLYKYPVAALLSTVPHNSFTTHKEHWVAIRGIVTDLDPSAPPYPNAINLLNVWFIDPAVNLGDSAVERFVTGSQWFNEFKPVNKIGSIYQGKYVAVYEPPTSIGVATAPLEVLEGRVISPEVALRYAAKWIKDYKLDEMKPYNVLKNAEATTPLLVNERYGGYYLIPYVTRANRLAQVALIVNAYNGNFQEVGTFKPVVHLQKEDSIKFASKHLAIEKPATVKAELIFPLAEQSGSRYFPLWKVTVNQNTLAVDTHGQILARIPQEKMPNNGDII